MNLNRTSGVEEYEIGADYIRVKFAGSTKIYTYTYDSAGRDEVEYMKGLARKGIGLNSYIDTYVKDKYVR